MRSLFYLLVSLVCRVVMAGHPMIFQGLNVRRDASEPWYPGDTILFQFKWSKRYFLRSPPKLAEMKLIARQRSMGFLVKDYPVTDVKYSLPADDGFITVKLTLPPAMEAGGYRFRWYTRSWTGHNKTVAKSDVFYVNVRPLPEVLFNSTLPVNVISNTTNGEKPLFG